MKICRDHRARGCKRAVLLKDEERFRLICGPVADKSNQPASKSIVISVEPAKTLAER